MLWLYLHFPHLLLDHVRRSQQTQGALAVVDLAGQAILQVCPEADHLGIRPGMRLKTALGLAPDLVILHLDSQQETNLLECEKRNRQRQQDLGQRKLQIKHLGQGSQQEMCVFVIAK